MARSRIHWTEAKVIEAILALKAAGPIPSAKQIAKSRPALYGGAQRVLGGWRNALVAAGLDPQQVATANIREASARRTKWTEAAILDTLKTRHAAGKPLDVTAMRTAHMGSLLKVARLKFGSYEKAVEAAGVNYSTVRLTVSNWSPEAVIDSIKALDSSGSEINISTAQHAQSSLVTAAIKYFGSWDNALRAAGFDPTNIRLDVNTEAGKGRLFENLCDALFASIRPKWRLDLRFDTGDGTLQPDAYDPTCNEWIDFKLAAWGMSVESSIRKYTPFAGSLRFITLQGERRSQEGVIFQSVFEYEVEATTPALREIFETMRQLEADRVPATRLAIWSRIWTCDKVLAFIHGLPEDQRNSRFAQVNFKREYSAATKIFGGWSEALKAAGIDPDSVKLRRDAYTKDDIDAFIRDRAERGERLDFVELTSTPAGNGLYQASQRLYGDWPNALRANGVDAEEVNGYTLSRQATLARLLDFIRARYEAGEPLNAQFIRDNFMAEYQNALRLADGWRKAVELAEIPYDSISSITPPQQVTKKIVDEYIQSRQRAGLPLTVTAVRADNRAILTAAYRHHYGSWVAALVANGIEYRDPRRKKA